MKKIFNIKNSEVIFTQLEESLKIYLKEADKYPRLNLDEEQVLFERIKNGDNKAKDTIITSNLMIVVSIAKRFMNRGLSVEDLINEGNIGLITALDNFDPSKKVKFFTYAVWWIAQSIQSAIDEKSGNIRLPANKIEGIKKLNKIERYLEQKLERKPSENEILDHVDSSALKKKLKLTVDDVLDIMSSRKTEMSLDTPIGGNDENLTLYDTLCIAEEDDLEVDSINNEIMEVLSDLTDQERSIIILNFGILNAEKRYDLKEIGDIYNLSKERVRQIKEKAIRKLRNNPEKTNRLFIYF